MSASDVMAFIFMLIGAVLGGAVEGDEGAVVGGILGFLAGMALGQTLRLRKVEQQLHHVRGEFERVDLEIVKLRAEMAPVELDLEFPDDPAAESDDDLAANAPGSVSPSGTVPSTPPPAPPVPDTASDGVPATDTVPSPEPVPAAGAGPLPAAQPAAMAGPASAAPDLGHPGQRDDAPGDATADPDGWASGPAFGRQVESGFLGRVLERIRSANPIVLIGIVVLFFGLAFGLKLAVDGGLVPIELRLAGIGMFGMGLWGLGWRMRHSRENFALPVQGAGAGALFLTVFAAYAFYGLLPAGLAFGLMLAMVVLTALMAVAQSSQALAALGVTGGFLAPVLVSTGSGDHVGLFSYYLLLNVLVLTVAWFNAWRILNLIGFFFTFGVGTAWGSKYYTPDLFASTEPFLVAFVLLYVAVAVLFALRQPPKLVGVVDGTLVFGTPLVGFALQTQLLEGDADALAISAIVASAFYMVVAIGCIRGRVDGLRTLGEAFIANSIIFATLAVPLALDARWTAATWALEGAGIVWIAVRQDRLLPRILGSLLQFLAGAALLADLSWSTTPDAFFNSEYLGAVLVAFGGLFCGVWQARHADRLYALEVIGAVALMIWGMTWWFGAGVFESFVRGDDDLAFGLALGYVAVSAVAMHWLADRTGVDTLSAPAHLLLPVFALALFAMGVAEDSPFDGGGAFGWPLALVAHVLTLRRLESRGWAWQPLQHGLTLLWLTPLLVWAAVNRAEASFPDTALWFNVLPGLVTALVVLAVTAATDRVQWPFVAWRGSWLGWGGGPLAALLALWLFLVNVTEPGENWPIDYVPLLNPIDIAAGFAILAGVAWWRATSRHFDERWPFAEVDDLGRLLVGVALFFHANFVIARTVHFWEGVPWYAAELFDSETLQSAYAVFWGVTGLVGMGLGNRRASRTLWFAAAALMGVVVLKLFLVDLANTGTMARVVSFVSVGVALMAVGYFAPLPPRRDDEGEVPPWQASEEVSSDEPR